MEDLNKYIKKAHIRAVEKFNQELNDWARETGDEESTLYEDAYTSFTLSDIRVENGKLLYCYDGREESENVVLLDDEFQEYYEEEYDGIMEYIKFWKSCLRHAKRYWSMDMDTLDAIQSGEQEDDDEEDSN